MPNCLMCGRSEETEGSGELHILSSGSAAHVKCMELYVVLKAMQELDAPPPFPMQTIGGRQEKSCNLENK